MGCFVVAGFLLTNASRGTSEIAELLVCSDGNTLAYRRKAIGPANDSDSAFLGENFWPKVFKYG